MSLEEMRRELMLNIHDIAGEDVLVLRESADYTVTYPLVVIDFLGPQRRIYKWLSTHQNGKENWVMAERVNIMVSTIQSEEGSDTSRVELQELLDRIEFGARKLWPKLVRKFGCGIFYPESWMSTHYSHFYNERRVNTAVLKITILEPRMPNTPFRGTGPPLERVTADYKDEGGTFEHINIQIED
jgi:hypothetical protein